MLKRWIYLTGSLGFFLLGCSQVGNDGLIQSFVTPTVESDWIRNGEPIEFEEVLWFPKDDVEVLLDTEVHLIGVSRVVEFFIDKEDVRPFNQLYTKFGRNKYRVFEKRSNSHD